MIVCLIKVHNPEIDGPLHRMQKLMLALIPRFIVNESTIDDIIKSENSIANSSEVKTTFQVKYFLEISSNLMLYCRNAVANHSADHSCVNITFLPAISETLQRTELSGGSIDTSPSLGLIVSQLKNTVEYHNKQKSNYDYLLRKKTTMSNNSLDLSSKYPEFLP